jgi:purine nucleosidase
MSKGSEAHLLVDTDGGVDDVLALLLALRTPGARVDLVTTVAGNATLADATRNVSFALELTGSDASVIAGSAAPLARAPLPPRGVHGGDGLGDLGLRPAHKRSDPGTAVDALAVQIRLGQRAATVVTLGPLSNLAAALRRDPTLAACVQRCVVMGGTLDPAAQPEFNLSWDPEAASLLLRSGTAVTIVPIELSRGDARLAPAEYAGLTRGSSPLSGVAGLLLGFLSRSGVARYGWSGEAAVPDAVAMAVALDPAIVLQSEDRYLDVEKSGDAAGRLVAVGHAAGPRVRAVRAIDALRFKRALLRALGGDQAD